MMISQALIAFHNRRNICVAVVPVVEKSAKLNFRGLTILRFEKQVHELQFPHLLTVLHNFN